MGVGAWCDRADDVLSDKSVIMCVLFDARQSGNDIAV
jgi:hypothetical protein